MRTFHCNLHRWSCTFDICLANTFLKLLTNIFLFVALFLHLKHFETSALLCVVKRRLLDIGFNLRYSLVLLSQTSNFHYSLKNQSPVWTIFVEDFYTFSKRGTESALFLFSATHSKFCCSAKSNKAALPNKIKTFSTVKLALCVQLQCLLIHNNFFVFNISGNCWKSSRNLWTLLNHNSQCQAKFLTCEISDFTSYTHAQSNILHTKYVDKTGY